MTQDFILKLANNNFFRCCFFYQNDFRKFIWSQVLTYHQITLTEINLPPCRTYDISHELSLYSLYESLFKMFINYSVLPPPPMYVYKYRCVQATACQGPLFTMGSGL